MSKKHTHHSSTSSFSDSIFKISHRLSLFQAFDDFLTMAIAACTQNLLTGKSWYEQEYLDAMEKYKDLEIRHEFPNAFASLISEMEARFGSNQGNDVLGEFFEMNISNGKNGQFFTPTPVCTFLSEILSEKKVTQNESIDVPKRILDPACGSGRMLLAAHRSNGPDNEYYGIDIDRTCIKMAALNLFLNGAWKSEVMCANSLLKGDFVIAYRITLFPLGIFKIEQKENSKLWHLYQNTFESLVSQSDTTLKSEETKEPFKDNPSTSSSQMNLFD